MTIGDGRGTSATTTYAYGGGKVDRTERQFLGFSAVTEIRPCLSNETACPYTFTTLSQQLASVGAPTAVYRYDGQDRILTKQVNTFTYNGATVPRTALLTQSDSYLCGTGDSVCMASDTRHTYETYGYDAYGNIALRVQRGDASITGDEVQTTTGFTYNTSSYIVNRPASLDVRAPGGSSALSYTTYEYDGGSLVKGDLTAVHRWLDRENRYVHTTASYDSFGNVTKSTDATLRGVTTLWDASGLFPTGTCYGGNGTSCASGVETQAAIWDPKCATPSQATDANAQTVNTTYDALCHPSLTTTPLSGYVQRYYLSTGNPSQQRVRVEGPAPTGVSGVSWSETYVDGLGRTWQTVQRGPSGQTIVSERSYNARGRVGAAGAPRYSSEATLWTDYEFDPLDRVTRVLLPGSRQVLTSYEATSSTTTDPDQKATTQRTDAYGRVTSVERAGGSAITRSGYDLLGRRTSMHDPVNSEWIWQFDSLGRMWDEQDPDAGHKSYGYDDAGRLLTTTDAKSQTTTLAYHSVTGRLQSRTNSAGLVSYAYSEPRPGYLNNGRLTTVTSPSDVLQTDYDALGRATRLSRTLDGTLYTVSQAFDASGRLSSTTYPDGDVIGSLSYDEAGRLASIPGIVSSISYDAVGRPLTQSNANATNTTWSYEAERQFLSGIQTTSPQGTIQDLHYLQYTDAGLLQHLTSPIAGEGWTYDYDDLNHLTTATNLTSSSDSQTWTYDAADRITYNSRVGSYTYPVTGQPRPHAPDTINGAQMAYDLNGNLWSGSGRTLVWDANNRITQATAGTVTTTFTYDGGGERLKKTSSQGTSLYPFGDDYEITNGIITKYVSVAGLGVVAKRVGAGAGAVTYWLHSDRLGSIQAVTNSAGTAVYRRTYRPYGETLATSGSHTESRGWIDQRQDGESGLTYLHARYFDPKLGTFLSADPIGVEGGFSQYAYATGDPVNSTDPSGLVADQCADDPQMCIELHGNGREDDDTKSNPTGPGFTFTASGPAAAAAGAGGGGVLFALYKFGSAIGNFFSSHSNNLPRDPRVPPATAFVRGKPIDPNSDYEPTDDELVPLGPGSGEPVAGGGGGPAGTDDPSGAGGPGGSGGGAAGGGEPTSPQPGQWAPAVSAGTTKLREACSGTSFTNSAWRRGRENFEVTDAAFLRIPSMGGVLPFGPGMLARAQGARIAMLGRPIAAEAMKAAARPLFAFTAGVVIGSGINGVFHALTCRP